MSCYHPLVGIWKGDYTASGKKKYIIEGNLDPRDCPTQYEHIVVPCGHCIGCRLDYSRSWADRMMLELDSVGKGLFVTLTYRNTSGHPINYVESDPPAILPSSPHEIIEDGHYYAPQYFNLNKRDCQLFMKRLRKEFPDFRIRFYLAGEYGEKTLRPHYHVILFGIGLEDIPDLQFRGKNELGHDFYTSDFLSYIWKHGYTIISTVSWRTCAYVGRYVTKKLCGPLSQTYDVRNCEKEFALMSRQPGLGAQYLLDHPDCLDYTYINLTTSEGGVKVRLPKYFVKFLDKENLKNSQNPEEVVSNPLYDPERYVKIMSDRKEFANDSMILKLQKTSLGYLDYLESEEQRKLNSIKSLNRGKVNL